MSSTTSLPVIQENQNGVEPASVPSLEIITRPGVDPVNVPGRPPLLPLKHCVEAMTVMGPAGLAVDLVVERYAPIPMRDGIRIYADIYRPAGQDAPVPLLLAWGPYGKHRQSSRLWPGADVEEGWISELAGFESPDPAYWCDHGYAVAYADPRGLWYSEGIYPHNGPQEGEDVYDAIEWLGGRDWCSGDVGMLGVSYLAGIQYLAASLQPPALKAISPWECFSDWYREFCYHGGIPETGFQPRVSANGSYSFTRTEHTYANVQSHPLIHDYYRSKLVDLEAIKVPAYVVASWSDHGLHTRGTLEAYARMGSEHKWLEVHGQKKWRYFYEPESVERQRAFFDHFLKGRNTEIAAWPAALMEIRDRPGVSTFRTDLTWPVDPDKAKRLHIDVEQGNLSAEPVTQPAQSTFDPRADSFDAQIVFNEEVELVGPMSLRLWLATDVGSDADVFVVLRKFDAAGQEQRYPINSLFDDGPVALGWLRASHRALDPEASTELRPVHPHKGEEPLFPGVPVALDVEIWPSGTVFHPGEKLVLTVQGRDFVGTHDETVPHILHEDLRNNGSWTIYSGGERTSYLTVPWI